MKQLTSKQQKSFQNVKICYIFKEVVEDKHAKDKKYWKVRDHCHYAGEYRGADTAYVIQSIVYLKKFLQFFTMDLTMIIILL